MANTIKSNFFHTSTGNRLASGIFWSFLGTLIARGTIFGSSILIARMFGTSLYGELGMIQSTVGTLGGLAGFGLGVTATKYLAQFRDAAPERAGKVIGLSSLFATLTSGIMILLLFSVAPWLASETLDAPHLSEALKVGSAMILFGTLNGAQTGALSGLGAFKAIARVNLIAGLLAFPMLIAGAHFWGLIGVISALGGNLFILWLLSRVTLLKELKKYSITPIYKNCWTEWPILWSCSLPSVIAGLFVAPTRWACNTILVTQADGYEELGIFTAALVFQGLLLAASGTLNAPLLSMITDPKNTSSESLNRVNIQLGWLIGLSVTIPMLGGIDIIQSLFGEQYQGQKFRATFAIVLFYTSIMMYSAGITRVLVAQNYLWWGVINNLLWTLILLPAAYLLSKHGATGIAGAFTIAYILTTIMLAFCYIRKGIVKRATLLNKSSALAWIGLSQLTLITIFDSPLTIKALSVLLAAASIPLLVRSLRESQPAQP